MLSLTRRYSFPAAHALRHPSFSEEENQRVFGKCANRAGHGHNYGLEVTVAGEVTPETGQLIDLQRLDELVQERVVQRFAYRLLNDDPAFREQLPTTENLARLLFDELKVPIAACGGARLQRVWIVETRKNAFGYGEES